MALERPEIKVEDEERNFIHVTWGRSGKRATPEEAQQLARFLTAGPDGP